MGEQAAFIAGKDRSSRIDAGNAFGAASVFFGFAFLYAALRSKDIFATDGAHRCLVVFQRQTIFFHENNHMLYPVNVLIWAKLAGAFGLRPNGPIAFYSTVELMNCFAAAAALAIVFLLIQMIVSSSWISLGAVAGLGVSKAFFLQATNANEAVVGLFWSLAAILVLVVALSVKSNLLVFISGLLFSLSMATYESMIFLAPAGLVLIWLNPLERPFLTKPTLVREGIFACGCASAWVGLHAWADWMSGSTRPSEMIVHLFRMQDAHAYLGLGSGKGLNLPVGLVRNVYPVLNQFVGLRGVLSGPRPALILFLLSFAVVACFLIACAVQILSRWKGLSANLRAGVAAALVALSFTLVPLILWDPQYEKLWLQPLVTLAFLAAVALKVSDDRQNVSTFILRSTSIGLLAGVIFNVPFAISAHRADVMAYFQDAQDVSQRVGRDDLVVADWGKVAVLYGDVWAPQDRIVDFISQAVYYGRGATEGLREEVLKARRRGGQVYFLGLLDESDAEWNSFIGNRCGVPISDIEPYREHSTTVATYRDGSATISLRQLDASVRE